MSADETMMKTVPPYQASQGYDPELDGTPPRKRWPWSLDEAHQATTVPPDAFGWDVFPEPRSVNPKDLIGDTKPRLDLVPPALVIEAAGPMKHGADKYGPFNWRLQPVQAHVYLAAVGRHLAAYADGQDTDEDSGYSHLGHAVAGLAILIDAARNGTLHDDRPAKGPAAGMLKAAGE